MRPQKVVTSRRAGSYASHRSVNIHDPRTAIGRPTHGMPRWYGTALGVRVLNYRLSTLCKTNYRRLDAFDSEMSQSAGI